MRDLAQRDQHLWEVRQLGSFVGDPLGLNEFIRAAWRIVPDPDFVELISSPQRQLALLGERGYLSGDCDDAATLAACVLLAMGWAPTLVAIRLHGNSEFSHVWCRVPVGFGQVLDIDPIVPADQLPIENYAESLEVPL